MTLQEKLLKFEALFMLNINKIKIAKTNFQNFSHICDKFLLKKVANYCTKIRKNQRVFAIKLE